MNVMLVVQLFSTFDPSIVEWNMFARKYAIKLTDHGLKARLLVEINSKNINIDSLVLNEYEIDFIKLIHLLNQSKYLHTGLSSILCGSCSFSLSIRSVAWW